LICEGLATTPNNDPTTVQFEEHTNNHNLPHQQCVGKPHQPFYVPFYFKNSTAAQAALPPASTHPDIIQNVLGDESKLTMEELTNRVCFDCAEVMQLISQEKHAITQGNQRCTTSADCTTTWANTALRGGCQTFTNQQGDGLLKEWLSKWDSFLKDSNQIESYHGQCGYATPMCMYLESQCVEGMCQGAVPQRHEIHYAHVASVEHMNTNNNNDVGGNGV
jgi:hypothetical protein